MKKTLRNKPSHTSSKSELLRQLNLINKSGKKKSVEHSAAKLHKDFASSGSSKLPPLIGKPPVKGPPLNNDLPPAGTGTPGSDGSRKKFYSFKSNLLLNIIVFATFVKSIASLYDITKLTSALNAVIVGFIFFIDIVLRMQAHLLPDEDLKKYSFSLRVAKFSSIAIMCLPIISNYFHHQYDDVLLLVLNIGKFFILSFMTDLFLKITKLKPPVW